MTTAAAPVSGLVSACSVFWLCGDGMFRGLMNTVVNSSLTSPTNDEHGTLQQLCK